MRDRNKHARSEEWDAVLFRISKHELAAFASQFRLQRAWRLRSARRKCRSSQAIHFRFYTVPTLRALVVAYPVLPGHQTGEYFMREGSILSMIVRLSVYGLMAGKEAITTW